MSNMLFDSHSHYFDRRYVNETEGADTVLERDVFGNGVSCVINVGTNNITSRLCIEQALRYDGMYAAVGIHPEDISPDLDMNSELASLYELIKNENVRKQNKIVAIGEIGLDYHYDRFDKVLQQRYFDAQLDMSLELNIPVIIHDRDAHGDCFETILRYSGTRGVFHSFSGSPEMAIELVKRGWYISFSGVLTFKNARKVLETAKCVPMERILIETDCPYLTPHPYRGKINHSGLMYLTAQRLAEIKNISFSDTVEITAENAKDLFGI